MRHAGANMRHTLEVLSQLLHFNFLIFFSQLGVNIRMHRGTGDKQEKQNKINNI